MTPYLWLIALSDLAVFGFALYAVIRWLAERPSIARWNARKLKRGVSASNSNSASPPKNMTYFLNTREDAARYVDDLRKLESDWQLTMTISPALYGGYYAFTTTSASSALVARAYLSPRLLTSLAPQELQYLESELLRVDRKNKDAAGGENCEY